MNGKINGIKVRAIRNKLNLSFLLIFSIIFLIASCIFTLKFTTSTRENLLTVSSVFAGFVYTINANMMEFSSRPTIKLLDKVGHMDKYHFSTQISLDSFIISFLIGVLQLFIPSDEIPKLIDYLLIYFIFIGALFFVISSYNMRRLFKIIREDDQETE